MTRQPFPWNTTLTIRDADILLAALHTGRRDVLVTTAREFRMGPSAANAFAKRNAGVHVT